MIWTDRPHVLGSNKPDGKGDLCNWCGEEPAEHRVQIGTSCDIPCSDYPRRWTFNLCGTCLAREQKDYREDMAEKAREESGRA